MLRIRRNVGTQKGMLHRGRPVGPRRWGQGGEGRGFRKVVGFREEDRASKMSTHGGKWFRERAGS